MKFVVEMDSVTMIYIRSFVKIDLGMQKLAGGYTEIIRKSVVQFWEEALPNINAEN
jgi:hypothetical protein